MVSCTLQWSFCYKKELLPLSTRGSLSFFYGEAEGRSKVCGGAETDFSLSAELNALVAVSRSHELRGCGCLHCCCMLTTGSFQKSCLLCFGTIASLEALSCHLRAVTGKLHVKEGHYERSFWCWSVGPKRPRQNAGSRGRLHAPSVAQVCFSSSEQRELIWRLCFAIRRCRDGWQMGPGLALTT